MRYLTLGALAAALVNNIIDGQVADAAPVQANIQGVIDSINNNIGNYSYQVPVNAFAIQMAVSTPGLVLDPAGVLATGTITLPAVPVDAEIVRISSSKTITTLTLSPSAGQTLTNAVTTLVAGLGVSYLYRLANNTWYRLS